MQNRPASKQREAPPGRPRLGISACLLGIPVRWDGQHKLDPLLRDVFGGQVHWVPACPEAECGLGVPREPMCLAGDPQHPRLIARQTGRDLTERIVPWIRRALSDLAADGVCGFVFKSDSPSCGLARIKVYGSGGKAVGMAAGIFARAFVEANPLLPVEDEVRLRDPAVRKAFILRLLDEVKARGRPR